MATVLVAKKKKADGSLWGYQFLNEGKPLKGKNGHPLFAFPSKSTPGNLVVREWEQKPKPQAKNANAGATLATV